MSLDKIKTIREKFLTLTTDYTKHDVITTYMLIKEGGELSLPYTEEEINKFETEYKIALPEELRTYLTTVSKYIYKRHLGFKPVVLSTDRLRYFKEFGGFNFNNKTSCSECEKCKVNSDYCDNDENECECNYCGYREYEEGANDKYTMLTLTLRDIGCGYTNFITLAGKYKGYVCEELLAGDGPVSVISKSFYDYVLADKLTLRS